MLRNPLIQFLKRHFFQRISFKLALVISGLVVALLLTLGIAMTKITQDVLKNLVRASHQEIAGRASREVSLLIERPQELLVSAAKLIGRTQAKPWNQETMLVELSIDFPMYEEITVWDREGKRIASSNPEQEEVSPVSQETFHEALSGRVYFSN